MPGTQHRAGLGSSELLGGKLARYLKTLWTNDTLSSHQNVTVLISVRKAQFIANKIAIQIVPTSEFG